MTARGTPSRFLTSVLHNGLGRYVQQLQRLSFTLSRDAPSSRGAREYVEREVADFARRNPGVVIYVNPRPINVPRVVAEYLNGAVREESIHCKSVEEITRLVQKLANQSGLDVIRIRKPFHTDSPSIQGQWHPFTNKPTTCGGLRPREVQDSAAAQDTGRTLSAAAQQSPLPCQPDPTRATRATRWLLRL
ncbi:mitochondrial ribosomal protein L43 [Phyllostomus discolor]|uniref:Large ribosomal subunit protein mL43 n=1 Tax=Phyllostomus discolor TaxID=89673 RepID=A0A834E711_9CHIR|nr:mitochondrial ribosomal protein L43 [Phyllostomus discolor]